MLHANPALKCEGVLIGLKNFPENDSRVSVGCFYVVFLVVLALAIVSMFFVLCVPSAYK